MASADGLSYNEERERAAFDGLAAAVDGKALVTSDWTFERYRAATRQQPLFEAYPDLLFVSLGRMFDAARSADASRPLAGLRVLDLGAGDGVWSVILAEQGAEVCAIEISPQQTRLARARMENHGLHWRTIVGSAFRLGDEFEDDSFDLVFGPAVLHHLTADLRAVFTGVHGVLKPNGVAVFTEPFMDVRWLRALRLRLAGLVPVDAESPDERPLTRADLEPLFETFADVDVLYRDLTEKFFRRFDAGEGLRSRASAFDRWLLGIRPFRKFATGVVLTARK